jgi:glycosyltransferase involved in cell wall biosynthesis
MTTASRTSTTAAPPPSTQPSRAEPTLPGLSIVLPCRNAEWTVGTAVRNAAAAAAATSEDYEIIVVDDGSSDATVAIAGELAQRDHHVRLLVHPSARGYGDALRSGIRAARHEWLLLAGADLEFDLCELAEFVMLTRSADVIWGWPVLRQGPIGRRGVVAARSLLVRALLHLPLRDVDCAFKLIRRELLEGLELTGSKAAVDRKIALRCRQARISQVGVHHRPASVRLSPADVARR